MKKLFCILVFLLCSAAHGLYAQEALKVTHPNGGETLVAGADTVIRWTGVPPQDTVDLHYSTNGEDWTLITREATRLAYKWRVPIMQDDTFLLRAQLLKERERRKNLEWYQVSKDMSSAYVGNPAMAFDSSGNIYIVGGFKNFIDFGNGIQLRSTGSYDGFLLKLNSAGKPIWAKNIGGGNSPVNPFLAEKASAVAIAGNGDVFVLGTFLDSIYFENGFSLKGRESNLYLAKYSADGKFIWAINACDATGMRETVAVASNGDPVIAGGFWGQPGPQNPKIRFGNGDTLLESGGNSDIFIAKFNGKTGKMHWVRQASGGLSVDQISSIALDADDNIYACGDFEDSLNVNDGVVLKGDWYSGFVAKFSPDGHTQWAQSVHSGVWMYGLAVLESGNLYICGKSGAKITFADGTADSSQNSGGFIAKYNNNGGRIWSKMIPGANNKGTFTLTADFKNNLYVCGEFDYSADFGGGITLPRDYPNFYTAKYDSLGKIVWARPYGGARQLMSRPSGDNGVHMYAVGMYGDWLPLSESVTLHRDSSGGIFLAKYYYNDTPDAEDISDKNWSVEKPELTVQDIDFGRVRVRTGRDTTLTAAIRNTGKYPMRVDYVSLRGRNYEEFSVLSSLEPFVLPPGAEKRVRIWFVPQGIGLRTATIDIDTQVGLMRLRLRGEGWDTLTNIEENISLKEYFYLKNNPVYQNSTIVFKTFLPGNVRITATNVLGVQKEIYSGYHAGGEYSIPFPAQELLSGFYLLFMENNGKMQTISCIIQK